MVMKVEPFYQAIKEIKSNSQFSEEQIAVIATSAKGERYDQSRASQLSKNFKELIILCGHYEGIDERVIEHMCDFEISIGDYVLTGGELPAMIILDSTARLLPGVLGNEASLDMESHNETDFVERGSYTRPEHFTTSEGEIWSVPDVLLSGNHERIAAWRKAGSNTND